MQSNATTQAAGRLPCPGSPSIPAPPAWLAAPPPPVQANHPVPRKQLLYYFEMTVREANGGSLAIGFSDSNFKQGRHPG